MTKELILGDVHPEQIAYSQMPPVMPPVTSQVHPPWRAPCWKFEKLQIMPLGFGYLESSEKSIKKNTQIPHI